jgi:hypothetical protein
MGFLPKERIPHDFEEFAPSDMLSAPDKLVQFQKVHEYHIV